MRTNDKIVFIGRVDSDDIIIALESGVDIPKRKVVYTVESVPAADLIWIVELNCPWDIGFKMDSFRKVDPHRDDHLQSELAYKVLYEETKKEIDVLEKNFSTNEPF